MRGLTEEEKNVIRRCMPNTPIEEIDDRPDDVHHGLVKRGLLRASWVTLPGVGEGVMYETTPRGIDVLAWCTQAT